MSSNQNSGSSLGRLSLWTLVSARRTSPTPGSGSVRVGKGHPSPRRRWILQLFPSPGVSRSVAPSHRPRIERVPPHIQVAEVAFDPRRTLERSGNDSGGLLVKRRVRNRVAERAQLCLERLDAGGQ